MRVEPKPCSPTSSSMGNKEASRAMTSGFWLLMLSRNRSLRTIRHFGFWENLFQPENTANGLGHHLFSRQTFVSGFLHFKVNLVTPVDRIPVNVLMSKLTVLILSKVPMKQRPWSSEAGAPLGKNGLYLTQSFQHPRQCGPPLHLSPQLS